MSGCCRSSGPMTLPKGAQKSSIITALAKSGTPEHPKDCKAFWQNRRIVRMVRAWLLPIKLDSLTVTKESRGHSNICFRANDWSGRPDRRSFRMKFPLEPQGVKKQQTARFAWYPVVARDKNHKRWIVWLRTVYLRWVATEKGYWEYVL